MVEFYLFIYLLNNLRSLKGERAQESIHFHVCLHSLDAYSSPDGARPMPGVWNSVHVSHVSGRDACLYHHLPHPSVCINWNWKKFWYPSLGTVRRNVGALNHSFTTVPSAPGWKELI